MPFSSPRKILWSSGICQRHLRFGMSTPTITPSHSPWNIPSFLFLLYNLFLSNISLKLSVKAVKVYFLWGGGFHPLIGVTYGDMFAWELLNVQYVKSVVCIVRVQVARGLEPGGLLSAWKNKRHVTLQPVKSAARNTSESHNWLHWLIKWEGGRHGEEGMRAGDSCCSVD